jgi:uncharacterized protein
MGTSTKISLIPERARYLIVDGHSVIFAWPELRKLQERRSSLAREALIKRLRDYQDWTGMRVVVVFDGKGAHVGATSDPHDLQIFYSRAGQTADSIVERLASKYGQRFELMVATSDYLGQQTANACGAECISPDMLRGLMQEAPHARQTTVTSKRLRQCRAEPIACGLMFRHERAAGRSTVRAKARSKAVRPEDSCLHSHSPRLVRPRAFVPDRNQSL